MTTRPASRRFDSLHQQVFLGLWRTYDRLRMLEDALFARYQLTPQQYNALRLLETHSPAGLPTLKLAARLVSRAPDITRMLDRLEGRGLVARRRTDDNRRLVVARLCPRGKALLGAIAGPLAECHRRQLGHLSTAQLRQLDRLLRSARAPHEAAGSPWK